MNNFLKICKICLIRRERHGVDTVYRSKIERAALLQESEAGECDVMACDYPRRLSDGDGVIGMGG